ncbi:MAG: glycosyltransferase family 39 protein [Leptospiraceae bacterium]|nr:glycosyltransferase family 39 protein [Leptospiraceae bacterium]MCP5499149.1 glycosyltransferase family 39 protein [Leptospiraceae bacterium]
MKKDSIYYYILILLLSLPYLLTLPLDVMDIDSAQYAEITREMVERKDFIYLRDNGKQYLDKPIMTFWSIALSYLIFGIHNYAYRIPAILITFFSVFFLYKLSFLLYEDEKKARLSSILYLLSPGLFAMVIDPKTDVYLVAFLIFTYYFYFSGLKKNKNYYYLMYLSMGLGFITKGPISAVIPAISIGGDILLRRDWKLLKEMKLIGGIPILLFFPLLWSYFLYQEFSFYGPNFFLWIQSFGKITGQGLHAGGKMNPGFFISNFSWAFLPFILPFFMLLFLQLRASIHRASGFLSFPSYLLQTIRKNEFPRAHFVIPFWLFLFFSLISLSTFQLPQYIFWVLPAASLYTADRLVEFFKTETSIKQRLLFYPVLIVSVILIVLIPIYTVDVNSLYYLIPILFILFLYLLKDSFEWEILSVSLSTLALFIITTLYIYPLLLSYQPAKQVAAVIKEKEAGKKEFFAYGLSFSKRSYAFYAERLRKSIFDIQTFKKKLIEDKERLLIVPGKFHFSLKAYLGKEFKLEKVNEFPSYGRIAKPEREFFLKKSRPLLLDKVYIYKVSLENDKNAQ